MNEAGQRTEAEAVADELHSLLHHERVEEIFSNDWLHDGSLPIPSVMVTVLLAHMLLSDPDLSIEEGEPGPKKRMNFFEFAGTHTLDEALPSVIFQLRAAPKERLRWIASREWASFEETRLVHEGDRCAEWDFLIHRFRLMAGENCHFRANGVRGIARRLLESMFLRAVFVGDVQGLRALAKAVEGAAPFPTTTNRIASEIAGWRWWLSKQLDREITKGAMKAFLCELYPMFPTEHGEPWTTAFSLAGWSTANDRKGPRKNADAVELARKMIAAR